MMFWQMKNMVMNQTGNDLDDLSEFMPYLGSYLNEGYDKLISAWCGEHVGSEKFPLLDGDSDEPRLPVWTHSVIINWATWLMYRNGNPNKQSRGYAFRDAAERGLMNIRGMGSDEKGIATSEAAKAKRYFINLPR
jgi:hypothetical protein